jgi:hypothetical protein
VPAAEFHRVIRQKTVFDRSRKSTSGPMTIHQDVLIHVEASNGANAVNSESSYKPCT